MHNEEVYEEISSTFIQQSKPHSSVLAIPPRFIAAPLLASYFCFIRIATMKTSCIPLGPFGLVVLQFGLCFQKVKATGKALENGFRGKADYLHF